MTSYQKAAELIAEGGSLYCCFALSRSGGSLETFTKFMSPTGKENPRATAWWGKEYSGRDQLARTLALLLMHEMGEK